MKILCHKLFLSPHCPPPLMTALIGLGKVFIMTLKTVRGSEISFRFAVTNRPILFRYVKRTTDIDIVNVNIHAVLRKTMFFPASFNLPVFTKANIKAFVAAPKPRRLLRSCSSKAGSW